MSYRLRLASALCVSCGICMDLCPPRAIAMRVEGREGVEGAASAGARVWMTFPFLALPGACDGCKVCELQCPVGALRLLAEPQEKALLA